MIGIIIARGVAEADCDDVKDTLIVGDVVRDVDRENVAEEEGVVEREYVGDAVRDVDRENVAAEEDVVDREYDAIADDDAATI